MLSGVLPVISRTPLGALHTVAHWATPPRRTFAPPNWGEPPGPGGRVHPLHPHRPCRPVRHRCVFESTSPVLWAVGNDRKLGGKSVSDLSIALQVYNYIPEVLQFTGCVCLCVWVDRVCKSVFTGDIQCIKRVHACDYRWYSGYPISSVPLLTSNTPSESPHWPAVYRSPIPYRHSQVRHRHVSQSVIMMTKEKDAGERISYFRSVQFSSYDGKKYTSNRYINRK